MVACIVVGFDGLLSCDCFDLLSIFVDSLRREDHSRNVIPSTPLVLRFIPRVLRKTSDIRYDDFVELLMMIFNVSHNSLQKLSTTSVMFVNTVIWTIFNVLWVIQFLPGEESTLSWRGNHSQFQTFGSFYVHISLIGLSSELTRSSMRYSERTLLRSVMGEHL